MKALLDPGICKVIEAVHYRPALSIILPLEAAMSLETELPHRLKIAADKAEKELRQYYPDEQCNAMMEKLRALLSGLLIPSGKQGIAIYLSLVFEKIFYLESPVTEKIIVDESFEIRDLLYDAKQDFSFFLLLLSGKETKLFTGNRNALSPLSSNIPKSIYDYVLDGPERVGNFSDMTAHKQTAIDNFLRHIDEELGNVINAHHLPVLIAGPERITGQFKKLSKHGASVIGYVQGNYEAATVPVLTELIVPYIAAWKVRTQQQYLDRLEEAAGQHKLAKGIIEAWAAACNGNGQMLIVEKNYRFAAQHGPEPGVIAAATEPYDHFAYIRDAVDDLMEKVLVGGGDVAFTEDGSLESFGHIALIKYHS